MNNKLIRKKPNKLLTYRRNYFQTGGNTEKNTSEKNTPGQALTNLGISAAGQIGGSLIGGGYNTGVGDTVSGLSSLGSAIPGIGGALTSAGLGVAGGLINRMFGSKLNKENIAKVEGNINELNTFQSNASDFDTLASNWANAAAGMQFDNSYIGSDGWFSHKASDKAKELRSEVEAGKNWVQSSLTNNAMNIQNQQMSDLWRNSAAYGGELFSNGGGIHIQPSKRGTFTAAATKHGMGVQEFASKVLANKGNYSPAMVKKANFARNASKWHAFGGDLLTHGSNFDTGITFIGNGGTHEANPYEGVPMGMDKEGVPNLVEEGEVIFDDYVFSNRLKVPKAVRSKYKLRGKKPITFADAALQMAKESEERPNDPISQAGLEDSMNKLMSVQEGIRAKKGKDKTNSFAYGGSSYDANDYRIGLQYRFPSLNPYEQNYIAGNTGYNMATSTNLDIPEFKLSSPFISKTDLSSDTPTIGSTIAQPWDKPLYEPDFNYKPQTTKKSTEDNTNKNLAPTWMRYAPVYASGIMSITDALGLTNKPDFSDAESILSAASNSSYIPVKFNPVDNYLTYKPFDRDYYSTKLNAAAGAARRSILNTAGGNRGQALASLLASDYNTLGKLGDLYIESEKYNFDQRKGIEEFNRGTNATNSEGMLKAAMANQEARLNARKSYLEGVFAAAELRQKERTAAAAARSANLSNFINSLGDIGRENFQRNMIMQDPSKYYYLDNNGDIIYKSGFNDLDSTEQDYIRRYATKEQSKYKKQSSKNA